VDKILETDFTRLNTRIRFIRESFKISKSELARRLEISPAYMTELESGRKRAISGRLAKVMLHELGVNNVWLMEGKGEPFLPGQNRHIPVIHATTEHEKMQTADFSAFERLLSEISATYINLPLNELEKVLRDDFGRLSKSLGFDACILFISSGEPGVLQVAKPLAWFIDKEQHSNQPVVEWIEQNLTIDDEKFWHVFEKWNKGETVKWSSFDDIPVEAKNLKQTATRIGTKSALAVPISFAGSLTGVLNVCTTRVHRTWPDELIPRLRLFGEVFINALMRKQSEEKLKKALSEIKELKEQIEADYLYLKEEINVNQDFEGLLGKSNALKNILIKAKHVAPINATVLILGETGTGKGVIARSIHNASAHRDRPMIQVNCAALAPTLIESELFGHEKGAFTGATTRRAGRFEAARGTTLFLDEIGDLPFELQPKLLRVLEEGEFERVGGNTTIHTDIRLIAATGKDLEKEVKSGRFRHDLWYRLNLFPIIIPPLRERVEDIPLLVAHFIQNSTKWAGKRFDTIPVQVIKALQGYSWPGNIRELKNVIERAVITSPAGTLQIEVPATSTSGECSENGNNLKQVVESVERRMILKALEDTNWIIGGVNGAARRLGLTPSTLRYLLSKLSIKRTISFKTASPSHH
jgi:formate hydrogenlyase transcriptional activator